MAISSEALELLAIAHAIVGPHLEPDRSSRYSLAEQRAAQFRKLDPKSQIGHILIARAVQKQMTYQDFSKSVHTQTMTPAHGLNDTELDQVHKYVLELFGRIPR